MILMGFSILLQAASAEVLSELTQRLEDLEVQAGTQQLLIYILLGILVVFLLVSFFIVKRLLILQSDIDNKQTERIGAIEKKINSLITTTNNNLGKMNDQMDILKKKQDMVPTSPQQQSVHSGGYADMIRQQNSSGQVSQSQQNNRGSISNQETNQPTKMVKFFSLQEGQGSQLSVLERHLVDDGSMAWFKMTITGDTASFEINPNAVGSILSDIPQLHSYAQPFDSPQNPTRVLTVRPGKMRKDGKSWIVTDKINVKLV